MNQTVQMPGNDGVLIVTGGSTDDFAKSCHKIWREPGKKAYTVTPMNSMLKKRVFHSMCYLNDKVLVVTGSRETEDDASSSVEKLDISVANPTWTALPSITYQ